MIQEKKETPKKKAKEKKEDKIVQLEQKISDLEYQKAALEKELTEIKAFISVYYNTNELKEEYIERTDATLISEFRSGRLRKYRSEAVALHKSTHNTVLDYMRDITWE